MDAVRGLLAEGAEVVAYDPVAGDQAVALVPEIKLAPEPLDAVEGAHALVVMTGWPELAELDPVVARERMAYPILVDARNALDAEAFGRAGFTVIGSAARSATPSPRPGAEPGRLLPQPGGRHRRRVGGGVAQEVVHRDMHQHRPVGEGPPVGVVGGGAGRRVDGQGVVDGAEKISKLLGGR